MSDVSEPLPAKDEEGNQIAGEFQPRILEPLIIQSGNENAADIKSEGGGSETVESEKRDSRRMERTSSDRRESERETKLGDVEISQNENVLVIPPVWTAASKEGNALVMYFFFRKVRLFGYFVHELVESLSDGQIQWTFDC